MSGDPLPVVPISVSALTYQQPKEDKQQLKLIHQSGMQTSDQSGVEMTGGFKKDMERTKNNPEIQMQSEDGSFGEALQVQVGEVRQVQDAI